MVFYYTTTRQHSRFLWKALCIPDAVICNVSTILTVLGLYTCFAASVKAGGDHLVCLNFLWLSWWYYRFVHLYLILLWSNAHVNSVLIFALDFTDTLLVHHITHHYLLFVNENARLDLDVISLLLDCRRCWVLIIGSWYSLCIRPALLRYFGDSMVFSSADKLIIHIVVVHHIPMF